MSRIYEVSDFCRKCGASIPPKEGEGTCLPHCEPEMMLVGEEPDEFDPRDIHDTWEDWRGER